MSIVVVVPLTVSLVEIEPQHMFALIADPEYPSRVIEHEGVVVAWTELEDEAEQSAYVTRVDAIAEENGFDTTEPRTYTPKKWGIPL